MIHGGRHGDQTNGGMAPLVLVGEEVTAAELVIACSELLIRLLLAGSDGGGGRLGGH